MATVGKSLKALILEADDLKYEDVDIPEWGVKVRIRGLSGKDRDAYEADRVKMKNQGQDFDLSLVNFRAALVVRCLFDPDTDERIFKDSDVAHVGMKSGAVLDGLYDVCSVLSGLSKAAHEESRANLDGAPNDGSSSD